MRESKYSQLFSVGNDNNDVEIYNMSTLSRGRYFSGHTKKISDMSFTWDSRVLGTCSMDKSIRLWDIVSGNCVQNILLDNPVISLDFSPSDDYLATSTANSNQIYLWQNLIGFLPNGNDKPIQLKYFTHVKNN